MGAEPALAGSIERLASIRSGSTALRRGSYRQLLVAAEQLGFVREVDGESVVVLLNAAARPVEVAVPAPRDGEWHDLLGSGTFTAVGGVLRAELPASWGLVLRAG
jgi:hypothetical protein